MSARTPTKWAARRGMRRTRGTTDDAPSAISAKVAFVTDAHKGLGAYVGVTHGAGRAVRTEPSGRKGNKMRQLTISRRTFRIDGQ